MEINMKYARFVNTEVVNYNSITKMINMGDSIQAFAVENLLSYAGIDQSDIFEIPLYSKHVAPEPCYLVLQGHFGRQYEMSFMDDTNIHPIFIGFGLKDSFLLPKEIEYYKRYEPILCRDEFTKNVLTKYGIEAYISGCLTETFPKRPSGNNNKRNKYYFVDVKEPFLKLIPQKIKQEAVFTSQNVYIDEIVESNKKWGERKVKERIEEYKENAKMVITPKLHCMMPCMALGIPTIAVGNNFSYRYTFADAFIEAYDEEGFKKFDWGIPEEKVDTERIKKLLLDVGKSLLEQNPDMDKIKQLDDVYTDRKKWNYCQGIKEQLKKIFKDVDKPEYILWGASAGGYTVHAAINELWPENKLLEIVDSFAKGIFAGKEVKKPQKTICKYPKAIVIVSTISGRESAENILQEMGKENGKDYFFLHESE